MKSALDSSVIVSALCAGDPDHEACRKVLLSARHSIFDHALTETFSTLTGGRLGFRVPTSDAAMLLRQQISPKLRNVLLNADELLAAFEEAEACGVRGGAIYDYLHLVAARKAGAQRFYTLNLSDFLSFHRPGDPEILSP
jgi:predicted nucleic acid-binding protein